MSRDSSQIYRLENGGRLNRDKPLRFWYDNKGYQGFVGDTLASALLANGVRLVARSFKYHRPRGIYTAGSEEPNALVQLETAAFTEPNRRATEVELYAGLTASSQNCWPSVNFDIGAINSIIARLLPAGFYYKTFMWPSRAWMTYEKYIRRTAGLGKSPTAIDPDRYDKTHAHCDVLIIGGGAAGLQAALSAGRAGARVMLVDDKPQFGGALLSDSIAINGAPLDQWITATVNELNAISAVTLLNRTTATGYYDYNFVVANQRVNEHLGPNRQNRGVKERLWKIRAKQVVLATGAIERPLVFADNDRPGVMLANSVRTYIHQYGVLPGNRIAVMTNNDGAYQTAFDAHANGAQVQIIDIRRKPVGAAIVQARALGIAVLENSAITAVNYARGMISGAQVMRLSEDGKDVDGIAATISCDLIAVSGGWTPTIHLFSQAKGKLAYLDHKHCFVPAECSANNRGYQAGACTASWHLSDCLHTGAQAGAQAAVTAGFSHATAADSPAVVDVEYGAVRPLWILPTDHPIGGGRKKHFHELHNDATVADIALAAREGFESVEHLKRYTTTGMGADQGKTSNINAIAAMADIRGLSVPAVGATTFRPPFTPLSFGAVVGHDRRELFLQKRKTAIHAWHDKNGAVYEDVGDWKRPFYFPKAGESMQAAVQRECLAARNSVGIVDASTLGKIDIQGADAADFLNLVYTNGWSKLAPGKCRYGLMLNEHGMVFDDGVTTCLAQNHYHMTTTTGGAARVLSWLEQWLQTEWRQMQVYCTSVTEQWAVASITGPKARALLRALCEQDLSERAFPFMSMQEFTVAGIAARVFRISFTGDVAFEINVNARHGVALWEALMAAGEKHGICAYGTEALHVLRAEKGFIIVGQDTDGTVTPMDLGMDWIVSKNKGDFLGRRSFARADTARSGRKQLVGLLTEDPNLVLPIGAHVVETLKRQPPMKMLGHVSSSYMSPNVGRSIAFGLINDGFNRKGQTMTVSLMDGSSQKVTVTDPVFLK